VCLAPFGIGFYGTSKQSPPAKEPVQQRGSIPHFVDITRASGVNFRALASHTSRKYLLETMGSGVALFDYDSDGRLDIFVVNGAPLLDPTPKGTIPEKTGTQYWNRLYHQKQDRTFEDVTEKAGLQGVGYLQQLRMFYWYSDPTQKNHDVRGMVQAAASILYPAFKENVESILPWTGLMKRGILFEGLLRFMDQQRRNNFYFFQNSSGVSARPMAFIPFENLGTLELGGQTGNVGKEIYGAGECLWMYLMFEALGHVDDREIMLANLDLLDTSSATQFPPNRLQFVLYNPTDVERTARISISPAQRKSVRFNAGAKSMAPEVRVPARRILQFTAEY